MISRILFTLLLTSGLAGCATQTPSPANPDVIQAQPSANETAARTYRQAVADDQGDSLFQRELRVWASMLDAEGAAAGNRNDAGLNALAALQSDGLLDDYVAAARSEPGWTLTAEEIRELDRDALYARREELRAIPLNLLEQTDVRPTPPGASLPSAPSLIRGGAPCAADREVRDALQQWQQESSLFEARPISAASSAHFYYLATTLGPDSGLIWVAPQVVDVLFLSGFCAIERNHAEAADEALTAALEVAPGEPTIELELASLRVRQSRPEDAKDIYQRMLARKLDNCTEARALRGLGFLHIEDGDLASAEAVYRRSLELDPGSDLANNQLRVIARLQGAGPGADLGASAPAPAAAPIVTNNCTPS